jgi:hypothetical protein
MPRLKIENTPSSVFVLIVILGIEVLTMRG